MLVALRPGIIQARYLFAEEEVVKVVMLKIRDRSTEEVKEFVVDRSTIKSRWNAASCGRQ